LGANAENKVTIATAGAFPPLIALLKSPSSNMVLAGDRVAME
jgi:hypothetical protein